MSLSGNVDLAYVRSHTHTHTDTHTGAFVYVPVSRQFLYSGRHAGTVACIQYSVARSRCQFVLLWLAIRVGRQLFVVQSVRGIYDFYSLWH